MTNKELRKCRPEVYDRAAERLADRQNSYSCPAIEQAQRDHSGYAVPFGQPDVERDAYRQLMLPERCVEDINAALNIEECDGLNPTELRIMLLCMMHTIVVDARRRKASS